MNIGTAITVAWVGGATPDGAFGDPVHVHAVTLTGVDQASPIGDTGGELNASASSIGATAGVLNVTAGDMVVYATVSGQPNDHTPASGYTEQIELDGVTNNMTTVTASKAITLAGTELRHIVGGSDLTVVAADLRGFGDSEKPDWGYERSTLANDIVELMGSLGFDRAVVVGQDWGGALSYVIALDHPEFVERLVVLDTSFFLARMPLPFHPEVWYTKFFEIPELPEKLLAGHEADFIKHFLLHWSHTDHYTEEDLAEYARAYSQPG